jgi:hypothetical protein
MGTNNLSDQNTIPTPCPHLNYKYKNLLSSGVAERWENQLRVYLKKIDMITQVRMLTWVTKKEVKHLA